MIQSSDRCSAIGFELKGLATRAMISLVVNLDNAKDRSSSTTAKFAPGAARAPPFDFRNILLSPSAHNVVQRHEYPQADTTNALIGRKVFSSVIVTRHAPENNAVGKNNVQLASAVVPSYLPTSPPAGRVPGSMRLYAFIHRLWEKLTPPGF
ncbi:unnamed protein product, partial [Iphiclides podalirius]